MKSNRFVRLPLRAVFLLVSALHPVIAAGVTYRAIDIGVLPGAHEYGALAWRVNSQGQVVGNCSFPSPEPERQAFVWDQANGMRFIYPLPAPPGAPYGTAATAWDINAAGQIVGGISQLGHGADPYLWDPVSGIRVLRDEIGTGGANHWGEAKGISSAGHIAGWKYTPPEGYGGNWTEQGFLWHPLTGSQEFSAPDADYWGLQPQDVNASGVVVGGANRFSAPGGVGFVGDSVNGWRSLSSAARAINDAGLVVGTDYVWDKVNGEQALAQLSGGRSVPFDINSAGLVVGFARVAGGPGFETYRAALWEDLNTIHDLNSMLATPLADGWLLTNALGISDAGQIICEATKNIPSQGNVTRAFFLTPVPEPAAHALAAIALLAFRRHKAATGGRARGGAN
jgi:hypothetical protein